MLSLVSLLANVLLVPLLSLCLAFGAAGAMLSALGLSFPGRLLLVGAGQLLGDFALGWRVAQQSAWNPLGFGPGALWVWPLYLLLVLALLEQGWFRPERPPAAAGRNHGNRAGTVSFAACPPFPAPIFSAYFLDVGQGGLCCGGHP